VGRAAFKKGSTPWVVVTPSHSPHALRPSTFRAPDGECPRCFRLVAIGGAQPRGGWHLSAIARLQGFSSGSPAASPYQWSRRRVTTGLMVGRSKPGCGLCPALSFKDLHHPCWGGGRAGACLRVGWRPASSSGIWGWKPSSSSAEEASSSHAGGRRTTVARPGCNISSFVRATVAGRTGGSHNTSYAARAVLVFWDGPILIFVARTGVRTCRCALGRPALAGAVLVGRWTPSSVLRWWQPEKVSPPTRSSVSSALRASGSLALISDSRPPRGDANESLPAVAFALGPLLLLQRSPASHPEFVVPQAPRCGGCSYQREWNRSSVCNGTLSAGVCSLWLSRPEHLGI
jgi:hypothetical protein